MRRLQRVATLRLHRCPEQSIFQEALAQGTAAADLFARVSDYYRRHWFIPAKLGERIS